MTMLLAYKVGAIAVRQRLAEQNPQALDLLNHLQAEEVAVYSGCYDRVQDILQNLQVPVWLDPNIDPLNANIIFVNCSDVYPEALVQSLAQKVQAGAWLISSDWALGRLVEHVFPGMVRFTQWATEDEVVSVEPSLNSVWSDVVVLGADPQWWLESSSHPIQILDSDRVMIEAASHDLLVRYNAPVVAVSFDWGQGHVFHVISHFWCKRSRTPTHRHAGPCTDFLAAGMKLSEAGIQAVLDQGQIQATSLNFAQIQSAATSTELVAQLCIRAKQAAIARKKSVKTMQSSNSSSSSL